MILPDFILKSRVNLVCEYSGIDDPKKCLDKKHFQNYPYKFLYCFNSRGFRDSEWPALSNELARSIWCVGDSFTVGLGSPREHTWVWQLQQKTNIRTINVSMDGASNAWIARKANKILTEICPNIMVIQWSYLDRDEINDPHLGDEKRRLHFSPQSLQSTYLQKIQAIKQQILHLESVKQHTKIIHSFVPGSGIEPQEILQPEETWSAIAGPDWPALPNSLDQLLRLPAWIKKEMQEQFNCYEQFVEYYELNHDLFGKINVVRDYPILDLARDGHHYDILTAQGFVDTVCQLLGHRA